MNCLIIDDQKVFRVILRKMMAMDPSLTLIGECSDAMEAHKLILEHEIDLLFLDIEMPGMNGVDFARVLLGKRPMIIFTTSRTEYAVEAFDLNVVDFLVKPVLPARFLTAVDKARSIFKQRETPAETRADGFVFIRDSNLVRKVKIDDILYLEASGDYVNINIAGQIVSIHATLKSIEQKLPAHFFRVHRSFIVNLPNIDTVESGTLRIQDHIIPVSDAYRAALNGRLNIL